MTHKKALERILDQYVAIQATELNTLEINVLNFACMALGVEMRQNKYGELEKPILYLDQPLPQSSIHRVK